MSNILETASSRVGRQTPTLTNVDTNLTSIADNPEIKNWLSAWGVNLLEWQWYVIRNSMTIKGQVSDSIKRFYYRNVGLSVPRQNGKSEILIARGLIGMVLLGENLVYSSYRTESADMIYRRMRSLILNAPDDLRTTYFPIIPTEKVREKALTAYHPDTGEKLGTMRFITRAGGAGRGATESIVFYDEAQELTEAEESSMSANVATYTNGQIWYVGTPEPAESASSLGNSSKGVSSVFTERRKNFKDSKIGSLWMEWGVTELTEKDDVDAWYKSNPSLGISMGEGRGLFEDDLRSSSLNELDFNIERLGFWATQKKNSAIDIGRWKKLGIEREALSEFNGGSTVLSIKSDNNESDVNVVLAVRKNGRTYVESMAVYDQNERWIDQLFEEFLKPQISNNFCKWIIIDGQIAATQIKPKLQAMGRWNPNGNRTTQGKIRFATVQDVQDATAYLVSSIKEKSIAHLNQEMLNEAVIDSSFRSSRDGSKQLGFYSISGKTNVNVLETASLAAMQSSKVRDVSEDDSSRVTSGGMVIRKPFVNKNKRQYA